MNRSGRPRAAGPPPRGAVRPGKNRATTSAPAHEAAPPRVTASGTRQSRRPVTLVVVCALVLLEAGLLVGLAAAWVVDLVRGVSRLPGATIFLVLFALGVATVLVLAARGLWSGRRWARSPVMTWQVLLVVMAVGWLGAEPAAWVVAVLVVALLVGVGLLLRPVVEATVEVPEAAPPR